MLYVSCILDADTFMHVSDADIFMHILDAIIFMHISYAVIFIHTLDADAYTGCWHIHANIRC